MEEHIDNYILGRMSNEERHAFEKEISANSELQEKVALHRDIVRAMRIERDKEYLQSLEHNIKVKEMTERRRRTFAMRISSIAVAACLVLGVFVHFDTQSVYRKYGLEITLAVSCGGGYSDIVVELINEGRYDEALSHIAEAESYEFWINNPNQEQNNIQWYKAVAYMRMGKYIKAKRLLKQIASSDNHHSPEAQKALDEIFNNE